MSALRPGERIWKRRRRLKRAYENGLPLDRESKEWLLAAELLLRGDWGDWDIGGYLPPLIEDLMTDLGYSDALADPPADARRPGIAA